MFLFEGLLPEGKCARVCPFCLPSIPTSQLGTDKQAVSLSSCEANSGLVEGVVEHASLGSLFSVIKVTWKLAKKPLSLSEVTRLQLCGSMQLSNSTKIASYSEEEHMFCNNEKLVYT